MSERAAATGEHRAVLVIVAVWVAITCAFSGTAFRIDEPNILAIARQIVAHPADPYGFSINWLGHADPAAKILANPPALPYWLALWGGLFGWREVPLHLAMLPFGVVALLAMASLARRWQLPPALAAALLLISPGFLVGSQVVMPDVAMLAFLLLTLAAAMRWVDDRSGVALAAMIGGAALVPLLKYNGIIVIPLLVLLAITHPRGRLGLALAAAVSAAALGAWGVMSKALYGFSHFGASGQLQQLGSGDIMTGSLAAIGLGVLPLPLALVRRPAGMKKEWDLGVSLLTAVAAAGAAVGLLDYPAVSAVLFAAGCVIAVRFLIFTLVAGTAAIAGRDWRQLLLAAWVAGVLAVQMQLIFSSVRYLLPLLPAAILLLLPHAVAGARNRAMLGLSAAGAIVALLVALGDARTANVARTYVRDVVRPAAAESAGGRLLFAGHWGFQWYMEEAGGVAIDGAERPRLVGNDLLVVAREPFPQLDGAPLGERLIKVTTRYAIGLPVHTIDCAAGANFYSNAIGGCHRPRSISYLPWSVATGPVETFERYAAGGARRAGRKASE